MILLSKAKMTPAVSESPVKQYIPLKYREESPPYFPTFAHEYFAHLVNTRLLKYCISLNFDELLESALEDELDAAHFQVVASRSEFERLQNRRIEDWEAEYGPPERKCFVFKPHGTISRGLTLRHLPERVQNFGNVQKCLQGVRSTETTSILKLP
jgi:hypothetical protein